MNYRKFQNLIAPFLLFGCFAFVILSIIIGFLSSLDRNITKLKVIIIDKPVFYFSGLDEPYFYSFSCEGYKCDFRIADETLDVVDENKDIREQVRSIKFQDTIDVFIQTFETERLQKRRSVNVVGLLKNNKAIIDPKKVFEKDKEGVRISSFLFAILGIGVAIWLIRKYRKVKTQHTTQS